MAFGDVWRGKDAERVEFRRLLTDIKHEKRSDLVYIDQTDRRARDTAGTMYYYTILPEMACRCDSRRTRMAVSVTSNSSLKNRVGT